MLIDVLADKKFKYGDVVMLNGEPNTIFIVMIPCRDLKYLLEMRDGLPLVASENEIIKVGNLDDSSLVGRKE